MERSACPVQGVLYYSHSTRIALNIWEHSTSHRTPIVLVTCDRPYFPILARSALSPYAGACKTIKWARGRERERGECTPRKYVRWQTTKALRTSHVLCAQLIKTQATKATCTAPKSIYPAWTDWSIVIGLHTTLSQDFRPVLESIIELISFDLWTHMLTFLYTLLSGREWISHFHFHFLFAMTFRVIVRDPRVAPGSVFWQLVTGTSGSRPILTKTQTTSTRAQPRRARKPKLLRSLNNRKTETKEKNYRMRKAK